MSGIGVIIVVVIMLTAGIAGGTINFALSRTEKSTRQDWAWAVAIGTGASFLMPLFLSTLSSDLLTKLLEGGFESSDPFVFAGFCLLGAIASRAMIHTLTDKLLKETAEVRQEVSELEISVTPILDKETEQDDDMASPRQPRAPLDEEPKAVLQALTESRFSLRSISGIVRDVKRDRPQVDRPLVIAALNTLSELGLASEVQGKKGKRWTLTPSGHRWIEESKVGGGDQ